MHDTRNKELNQSYLAERGVIVQRPPSNYLVMTNGHIVRRTDKDEPAQIIAFEKYAVDLDQFEKKMDEDDDDLKPRERYLSELLYPEATSGSYRKAPGKFRAELHERFANPLYPLAFALIALAAVGQAHSTRQNRVQQVALAFVLAAALRLGGLALNNIVVTNEAATALLYALPLSAMLGALMSDGARPPPAVGLAFSGTDLRPDCAAVRVPGSRCSRAGARPPRRRPAGGGEPMIAPARSAPTSPPAS